MPAVMGMPQTRSVLPSSFTVFSSRCSGAGIFIAGFAGAVTTGGPGCFDWQADSIRIDIIINVILLFMLIDCIKYRMIAIVIAILIRLHKQKRINKK